MEKHRDLSGFLDKDSFDLTNAREIMEQFGEYTNNDQPGTKKRRLDEIDIIMYDEYERDEGDIDRYGDIWRKKTEAKNKKLSEEK